MNPNKVSTKPSSVPFRLSECKLVRASPGVGHCLRNCGSTKVEAWQNEILQDLFQTCRPLRTHIKNCQGVGKG